MKKYLPGIMLLATLASCTNEPAPQKNAAAPVAPQQTTSGGCGDMVIFQKGRMIQNVTRDSSGAITVQSENRITAVEDKDSMLVSTMEISAPGETPSVTEYRCDGKSFYISMVSLMGNMNGMTNIKSNAALMAFPLTMNVGDTLENTSLRMTFTAGDANIALVSEMDNRRVDSKEKVTTGAGSWECYKVSSAMHIDSRMQSLKVANNKVMQMTKELKMIAYFTPRVGLVKMEIFKAGHLVTSSEITSIR